MRLLATLALWLALLAAPAPAADPIMPLGEVQRGMKCEGRSVFRGTAIETFEAEILDVIAPTVGGGAGILIQVSGPRVGAVGLGPGFSGSPIYCPGSDGTLRNAGAVAAGIGDYGNDVMLATPIEDILGTRAEVPAGARASTAAERRARPWSLPLTVSGVSTWMRRPLWRAAAREGLQLLSAPASAAQVETGADLQPGSAVAAAFSTGTIGINATGTVAYRDGDRVWAFGHPLDNVGDRSLIMQGAFVHAIIGNPDPGFESLGTYKLASPGTPLGTVGFDGLFAITGVLGALPDTIPLEISAQDGAGNALPTSVTHVSDESALGYPSGIPALSFAASVAVADRASLVLGADPGRSYGRMCMRIEVAERDKPLRFCNRYVGDGGIPGGPQIAMAADATAAASLVEQYDREQLDIERVRVSLELAEGMRFAKLRDVAGPRTVRPGERVRLRLRLQRPRQPVERVKFQYRVPRTVKPGRRTLTLRGADPDPGETSFEAVFELAIDGLGFEEEGGQTGSPTSLDRLARAVARTHRYDGIRASFRKRSRDEQEAEEYAFDELGIDGARPGKRAYRHPRLRIGGTARLKVRVLPRAG